MIIAVDYGTKYLGLAESDETETICRAIPAIVAKETKRLPRLFIKYLRESKPNHIIYGKPTGFNGKPTQMSETIRRFAEEVFAKTQIPYDYWDETMTSTQADLNIGKSSTKIHSEAARIILQEYLDNQKYNA